MRHRLNLPSLESLKLLFSLLYINLFRLIDFDAKIILYADSLNLISKLYLKNNLSWAFAASLQCLSGYQLYILIIFNL